MATVAEPAMATPLTRTPLTFTLRCYVAKRAESRYVGVCLRPNLVVEARSQDAAMRELEVLIDAYIESATSDAQVDHFMSQRAPLRFYVEYWMPKGLRALNSAIRKFTETRTVQQHA